MKLTKFVPCNSSCASQALLSFSFVTWQLPQPCVSRERTVCGTCALKAWLEYPGDEIGGCWM